MLTNDIIQGLWIGNKLSTMEHLRLASFLAHGHKFHLYTYEAVENMPRGITLKDAATILPASMIFQYRNYKSYAGFANYFRYKLLLEKGGVVVRLGYGVLAPFRF